ncbi:hypothetical protein B296_00007045 [Ensete ventricosum]|uniref:Uncharacterized protein n=1 Tax=Ensete ventricosum TaxID=4639 RepID=A0A427B0G3_ENSVE|nr:hypothetical protein B296_00007045 [Ensete ventricosum]
MLAYRRCLIGTVCSGNRRLSNTQVATVFAGGCHLAREWPTTSVAFCAGGCPSTHTWLLCSLVHASPLRKRSL